MTVGERIRQNRLNKKMTQKELGEKADIAEPTIRRYELGKLNPKLETLLKIATALDVSVFDLMDPEKCLDDFKKGVSEPIDIQNPDIQKAFRRYIKDGKLEFPGLAEGSALDAENRENDLLCDFRKLNGEGQQKAIERVQELTEIPRYQKDKNA